MFSDGIGLQDHEIAPLPWMPPSCNSHPITVLEFDRLKISRKLENLNLEAGENEVTNSYAALSPENSVHEMGARVTMALEKVTENTIFDTIVWDWVHSIYSLQVINIYSRLFITRYSGNMK